MNCSTPGPPIHHQLLEFTQTHVRWFGDAIQPSHPLSSPFSPALNLSQHKGLFKWISSLHLCLSSEVDFRVSQKNYISLKPYLLNTISHHNQSTNLITWTKALSNSMKLWAMPCRAIQDTRVIVESSEKCSTLKKGMANHFSSLDLRTPWTAWKGKKIGHWKINFPGR